MTTTAAMARSTPATIPRGTATVDMLDDDSEASPSTCELYDLTRVVVGALVVVVLVVVVFAVVVALVVVGLVV
jgi:hypothetical protein